MIASWWCNGSMCGCVRPLSRSHATGYPAETVKTANGLDSSFIVSGIGKFCASLYIPTLYRLNPCVSYVYLMCSLDIQWCGYFGYRCSFSGNNFILIQPLNFNFILILTWYYSFYPWPNTLEFYPFNQHHRILSSILTENWIISSYPIQN